MKLVRFGEAGQERPGILDPDGAIRDLGGVVSDINADVISPEGLGRLSAVDIPSLPNVQGNPRFGPPLHGVGKIVAVGLNYSDHAQEVGATPPKEPILFMKAVTALSGPDDPVVIPPNCVKLDWEVELAVVIGRRASYVDAEQALQHVAGYSVMNDVSERELQTERGGQWVKGKSHDTFAPFGPFLVTADEIADPQNLAMWCEVDGHRYQDSSTRLMIFGVAELISYISRLMTLMPGDIIATGTPAGVGLGLKPQVFLKPGQTMRLGIERLGQQEQKVLEYEAWSKATSEHRASASYDL